MKKIWGYLAAFVAGVIAVLAMIYKKDNKPIDPDFKPLKKPLEDDIRDINEKINDIKENGVKPMNVEETLDYWDKNQ